MNDPNYDLLLGKVRDMSDYIHKPDKGSLFVNYQKSKDTQPDYTGTYCTSDGQKRRIAAWVNKTSKGEYLSLSFQDEYNNQASA